MPDLSALMSEHSVIGSYNPSDTVSRSQLIVSLEKRRDELNRAIELSKDKLLLCEDMSVRLQAQRLFGGVSLINEVLKSLEKKKG